MPIYEKLRGYMVENCACSEQKGNLKNKNLQNRYLFRHDNIYIYIYLNKNSCNNCAY